MTPLLAVHTASTCALVGLIWTVQLVHYPLFAQVGSENFRRFHARHSRQITWIVAPLMVTELLTAVILLLRGAREPWLLVSFVPLAFNWLSTWRILIPLHNRLASHFDPEVHRQLVASNWWRTAAWSLRGSLLLYGVSLFQ